MKREILKLLKCTKRSLLICHDYGVRCFSTNPNLHSIDKKVLTSLRKETGYPFAKCNEALKVNENNLEKAVEWLHKQAEQEGWSKAQKLKDRSTSQGLVGVLVKNNFASLVEVACETDFVARNDLFQEMVSYTASAVLNFRKQIIEQNAKVSSNADEDVTHLREVIMEHELKDFAVPDGHSTLEEHLVSLVGKIGENMRLKRAIAIATGHSNIIGTSTHGSLNVVRDTCQMGSYAGLVVLKPLHDNVDRHECEKLARGISQHVIGMNPLSLKANDKVTEEESLLGQEFLLNDKFKVQDLVEDAGVEVVDFVRYSVSS